MSVEEEKDEEEKKRRNEILRSQRSKELEAREKGVFTENQRVRYYHRANGWWLDNVRIVCVHFDEDPTKPYYVSFGLSQLECHASTVQNTQSSLFVQTIQYSKGTSEEEVEMVEKQTTGDRLDSTEWDGGKSWKMLFPSQTL